MVESALKPLPIDRMVVYQVMLAVEEACANAVEHALGNDPSKQFQVELNYEPRQIVVTLRHDGIPFDPTRVSLPKKIDNPLAMKGFGIFLLKNLMDSVEFKGGPETSSTLTLKKNL